MAENQISFAEYFQQQKEQFNELKAMLLAQKSILTFAEACTFTGIAASYMYKLTSTGGVPCYSPKGKLLYFDRIELENWCKQNPKTTSEDIEQKAIQYVAQKGGGLQ
jgi:excisionase family DNA binding protein